MPADSGTDGYMYFVGPGKYIPDMTKPLITSPFGNITGETLDFRFEMKGAFKIASFSWRSSREGLSMDEDEDEDDGNKMSDDEKKLQDIIKKKNRKERQMNRAESAAPNE